MSAACKKILVTGGNSGIGLALCKQLAADHGCHVIMGSRSAERGQAALESIQMPEGASGKIELLQVDVGDDASVAAAAAKVGADLGGGKLFALVNNAGIGLAASAGPEETVNTNFYGPKRMIDAFLPMISDRVVNLGSGAGPGYVKKCPPVAQNALCTEPASFEAIEALLAKSEDNKTGLGSEADGMKGYGPSKAMLTLYTMLLAKQHPEISFSCCSPGFIDTKLVAGFGATKPPEEGTVAIRKLLFEELGGNGWYYGSDCVRSPLHFMRNPGEPEYDGVPPPVVE